MTTGTSTEHRPPPSWAGSNHSSRTAGHLSFELLVHSHPVDRHGLREYSCGIRIPGPRAADSKIEKDVEVAVIKRPGTEDLCFRHLVVEQSVDIPLYLSLGPPDFEDMVGIAEV